jgi:hypothetical protein
MTDPVRDHGHAQSHDTTEDIKADAHSVIQIVKNFLGGGTRAQDTMLALSIVVNVLLAVLLYGAWKDRQTAIMLASDALTKENAELRAQYLLNNALLEQYGLKRILKPEK